MLVTSGGSGVKQTQTEMELGKFQPILSPLKIAPTKASWAWQILSYLAPSKTASHFAQDYVGRSRNVE